MTKSKTNNGLADSERPREERQDRCRPRQNAGDTRPRRVFHPVTIRGNNLHSGHSRAFSAAHHPTVSLRGHWCGSAFLASDRLERNARRRAGRPVVSEHEKGHVQVIILALWLAWLLYW